ncbi:MAG: EcsC family protein [Cyclobacteriaceae bacterium]
MQDNSYERKIRGELATWQSAMKRSPSFSGTATKSIQKRINKIIPEKVHKVVTKAIKELTRGVIFGAEFTTFSRLSIHDFHTTEDIIKERVSFYTSSAAAEGAITGFGGFLSGLADFPLWLTLKMKMLFEIASHYGIDIKDYRERVFILYVFQLAFSSQQHRNKIYEIVADWENQKNLIPSNIHDFDWRTFQLEYRDHIDLAKLLQLIPGIGAVVGAYVNHKLTNRLGNTAMNAYRMRLLENYAPYTEVTGDIKELPQ